MSKAVAIGVLLLVVGACGRESQPSGGTGPEPATKSPARPKPREFLPRLTDAHLPPVLAGLVPGTSSMEDVLARFPELEADTDRSLGGDMSVQYNGHAAVALRLVHKVASGPRGRPDGVEEFNLYLVPDAAGVPRIWSMRLVLDTKDGPSLCEWLHEAVGSDPHATECLGTNRSLGRVGKSEDAGTYCLGTPDGKTGILVECRSTSAGFSELEYDLLRPAMRR